MTGRCKLSEASAGQANSANLKRFNIHTPHWRLAGVFLGGLFVFVRPITFSLSFLATLFVPVGIMALSPDRHAGSRIMAAAFLGLMSWGIVFGACLVKPSPPFRPPASLPNASLCQVFPSYFRACDKNASQLVTVSACAWKGHSLQQNQWQWSNLPMCDTSS